MKALEAGKIIFGILSNGGSWDTLNETSRSTFEEAGKSVLAGHEQVRSWIIDHYSESLWLEAKSHYEQDPVPGLPWELLDRRDIEKLFPTIFVQDHGGK